MTRHTINWLGKEYPAVNITIFSGQIDEMEITVSTTDLEKVLIQDMECDSIVQLDAIRLDETVAYYIEPHQIYWQEDEIIQLIEDSYAV